MYHLPDSVIMTRTKFRYSNRLGRMYMHPINPGISTTDNESGLLLSCCKFNGRDLPDIFWKNNLSMNANATISICRCISSVAKVATRTNAPGEARRRSL